MIPAFTPAGNLPPGIHWATWQEVVARFGGTSHRRWLLDGLKRAIDALHGAGCRTVYIDGSFVSATPDPGDWDGCWERAGVDRHRLEPVLQTFDPGRQTQKAAYRGEFFVADSEADSAGTRFLDFFQRDKTTRAPKGIVGLDLRGWS